MESSISETSSVIIQKDTDIVMTDELTIVSSDVTTTTTDSVIVKDLHDNIIQSNNINNTTETTTVFTSDNVCSIIQSSHLCGGDDDAVRKRLATSPIDDMMMDSKRRAIETNSVDSSSKITNIIAYCPVTSFSSQHTPPSLSSSSTCQYESKITENVSNSVLNGHIKLDAENSVTIPIIKIDEKLNGIEEDISESSSHMDDDTNDNIVVEDVVQNINDNNNDIIDTVCSEVTESKNQSTNHHHDDTTVLPPPICTEIRITFTAIDLESRLSLTELCLQLPNCKIVDSAEEATHLVAKRLIRTPKTYMAVALGCYVVTPKWIQASVMCGYWLGKTIIILNYITIQ